MGGTKSKVWWPGVHKPYTVGSPCFMGLVWEKLNNVRNMNLSRKKNSVSRVEAGNTVILGLYAIKILCVCVSCYSAEATEGGRWPEHSSHIGRFAAPSGMNTLQHHVPSGEVFHRVFFQSAVLPEKQFLLYTTPLSVSLSVSFPPSEGFLSFH